MGRSEEKEEEEDDAERAELAQKQSRTQRESLARALWTPCDSTIPRSPPGRPVCDACEIAVVVGL